MKNIIGLLLVALLFSSNGCMTYEAVRHAKGKDGWICEVPRDRRGQSEPAFYALVPLTVPVDVATSPLQLVWYLLLVHAINSGSPL
jgi:hypothetical protein